MIGMLGLQPLLAGLSHPPATTVSKFQFIVGHLGDTHKLTAVVRPLGFARHAACPSPC